MRDGGIDPDGRSRYGACSWFVVREGGASVPDAEPTCGGGVPIAG